MTSMMSSSSDSWVEGTGLDTAHTHAAVAGIGSDLAVAGVTPGGAPGVPDEEVVDTVLLTVADSHDSVVNGGSAEEGVGQNTRLVGLEVVGLGIDGDGDWLQGDGTLESSVAGWGHLGVGSNTHVRCTG